MAGLESRGAMNMKRRPTEMAKSIGSQPSELRKSWQALRGQGLGPESVVQDFGSMGSVGNFESLQSMIQLEPALATGLNQLLGQLIGNVIEQTTASELISAFGVPESLLAMPVFLELQVMEVESQRAVCQSAEIVRYQWQKMVNQIIAQLKLFLAERINSLEQKRQAHQHAWRDSLMAAGNTQELNGTMATLDSRFMSEISQIDQQIKQLRQTLGNIEQKVQKYESTWLAPTVLRASEQRVGPTIVLNSAERLGAGGESLAV